MKNLESIQYGNSVDTAEETSQFYKRRRDFAVYAYSQKMTLEEIGKILRVSKQRAYQIVRYAEVGRVGKKLRTKILERDKDRCRLCTKKNKRLHIHHLENPKDKRKSNLITLCPQCHKDFEKFTKELRQRNEPEN